MAPNFFSFDAWQIYVSLEIPTQTRGDNFLLKLMKLFDLNAYNFQSFGGKNIWMNVGKDIWMNVGKDIWMNVGKDIWMNVGKYTA